MRQQIAQVVRVVRHRPRTVRPDPGLRSSHLSPTVSGL